MHRAVFSLPPIAAEIRTAAAATTRKKREILIDSQKTSSDQPKWSAIKSSPQARPLIIGILADRVEVSSFLGTPLAVCAVKWFHVDPPLSRISPRGFSGLSGRSIVRKYAKSKIKG